MIPDGGNVPGTPGYPGGTAAGEPPGEPFAGYLPDPGGSSHLPTSTSHGLFRTSSGRAAQMLAFTAPGSPADVSVVKIKYLHCVYPYCA